jgi:atypical dual specificity phosphatase
MPVASSSSSKSSLFAGKHGLPSEHEPPAPSGTLTHTLDTLHLSALQPRPIPNSYWATESLLACEYPWAPTPTPGGAAPKLDAILRAGVRTFVDLTEPGELRPYAASALSARAEALGIDASSLEYHNFPIPDRCLPRSRRVVAQILSVLADAERRGRRAAVHCRGGIGRTGLVVGCWLVSRGTAKDGEEALAIIAKEWCTVEKHVRYPLSPETGPQFEFVRSWEGGHFGFGGAGTCGGRDVMAC